jgi:hypothetical protein
VTAAVRLEEEVGHLGWVSVAWLERSNAQWG